ncbi:MAG TPA: tyrosine-type recombinase/integrase [Pirellulales bacterium]|jgi:integrase
MPRPRKPWYRRDRSAFYVEFQGRQILLAKGPPDAETRQVAEQKFHALMAECLANPPVDGGNPTVASLVDAFLDYSQKHDAESTHYERKLYLEKFVDDRGRKLVRDCKPYDLTSWIDAHSTWHSDATKSYAVRTVKRAFNWAVEQGLIPHNPFDRVRQRSGGRRRPMTEVEFKSLLKTIGRRSRIGELLRFVALTGCRSGEARLLRWREVDLHSSVACLSKHKTARTLREPKPRVIRLVADAVKLLNQIRRRNDHADFVFVSSLKRPWRRCSIQQAIRRARRAANLPEDVVLYGLRHRFGTESIKHGNDLKTTAELMGHSTTRMTEHYVHFAGEDAHLDAATRRAASWAKGA